MRFALLALSALLPLAGCVGDAGTFDDETGGVMPAVNDVFLTTDRLTFSGSFIASLHGLPMESLPFPLCEAPTAECDYHDFTIVAQDAKGNVLEDEETTATMTLDATLTWGSPATDLGLYLLRDGTEVARSNEGYVGVTPSTESISIDVGPGEYQVLVVGWYVAMDTYEVDVTFR